MNNAINVLLLDFKDGSLSQLLEASLFSNTEINLTKIYASNDFLYQLKNNNFDLFLGDLDEQASLFLKLFGALKTNDVDLPFIGCTNKNNIDETTQLSLLTKGISEVISVQKPQLFKFFITRTLNISKKLKQFKQIQLEREEQKSTSQFLSRCSEDAIAYVSEGILVGGNQVFANFFQQKSIEELLWTPFLDLVADADQMRLRSTLAHKWRSSGDQIDSSCSFLINNEPTASLPFYYASGIHDGVKCLQIAIRTNQHNKQPIEPEIKTLDYLTGLVNRNDFITSLDIALSSPASSPSSDYVLFIKLDKFDETIADIGLSKSDRVIMELAEILTGLFEANTLCARFSEQVFTVLLKNIELSNVTKFAKAVADKFAQHKVQFSGLDVSVTVSIGICLIYKSAKNAYEIMSNAHAAYHSSLAAGGNTYSLFDPDKIDVGRDEKRLQSVEFALANGSLKSCYIPFSELKADNNAQYTIVTCLDGQTQQNIQNLMPNESNCHLDVTIDRWTVEKAVAKINEFQNKQQKIGLFCFLSLSSISDANFLNWLQMRIEKAKLPSGALTFELALPLILNYPQRSRQFCSRINALGCKIAISSIDIEIGNGELKRLLSTQFDFAILSENTFLGDCEGETDSELKNFVRNFHQQNKMVMARKINSNSQLMLLWELGIDYFQGESILFGSKALDKDYNEKTLSVEML